MHINRGSNFFSWFDYITDESFQIAFHQRKSKFIIIYKITFQHPFQWVVIEYTEKFPFRGIAKCGKGGAPLGTDSKGANFYVVKKVNL